MPDYENEGSTILDIDTDTAMEPCVVPEGEYTVRITGQRKDREGNIVRTAESGSRYFIITFDIPSEIASKGLSKIFSVPTEDMEEKRANACKWDLKIFKQAFGLDAINFDAMIGREADAILYIKDDLTYGESNEIRRFITGA